nr:EAL domain-containing protein [uncultured Albidiferax sp.]
MAKILVVDDLAENRELLVALIRHGGHQPLEAADGAQGLALVRTSHPDLVISDILMPTMDGYEFVRQLRADPLCAATEVIFYTAHYLEREARNLAKTCGVLRVLVKPCEPEEILLAIAQSLAHLPEPQPMTVPDTLEFDRAHMRLMSDKLSEKLEDLRGTNRRLAALTDLNLHLASEHDPLVLLDKVCRGARDLMGAKYVLLCVQGKYQAEPVFFTSGIDAAVVKTLLRPAIDHGVLGEVRAQRRPRRTRCADGDPTTVGLPKGYPPLYASLVVPVVSLSYAYGWMCLVDKLGAVDFSDEDEQIVAILAAQVGRIFENGSLYKEVRVHAEQLQAEVAERKRSAEALAESNRRFSDMLGHLELVSQMLDCEGRFTYCNDYLLRLTGWQREEVMGREFFGMFLADAPDAGRARFAALLAEQPGMTHFESEIQTRQGARRLIRWNHTLLRAACGQVVGIASIGEDITDQRAAEQRIKRLNRVYAVLSGINALIVRVRNHEELFQEACRIAVELGQFKMAWIGVTDWDALQILPIASAGVEPEFLAYIQNSFSLQDGTQHANSMTVRAIKGKKPLVLNDMKDFSGSQYLKAHMDQGICAMAILPLLVGDTVVGVLALYADEAGFFDDEEMTLLTELAGDIGFALDHIEKADKLNYLAYYDEITGLPNRTLFLEQMSQQLRMFDGGRSSLALALVDIERFRAINDTLGRAAGDDLLKQLAQRIRAGSVPLEAAARVGVNCFGVVLQGPRDVARVALELEQLLRDCFAKPYVLQGSQLRIAGKIGVVLYPLDGEDAETLLRNAESALKRAKGSAEQLMFYAPEMDTRVAAALDLESRLRTALDLEQFVLHYQPKVDLDTGKVTSAEALIRWNDPKNGLVAPGHFIPVLEETGLIYEVGLWALRKALEDHQRWRAAGLEPVRIAVNVSALQLRHRNFVAALEQVIGSDPHAAQGLELEITESLIMDDVQRSSASLLAIRAMGLTIAIDDFGTGYSSLGQLSRLPVDTLKIDRTFVVDMVTGPRGLSLVSTIINLAHAFKLKVVAEGVETEEQSRLLRLMGCDEMQGFLFSRPVPAYEFEQKFLLPARAA